MYGEFMCACVHCVLATWYVHIVIVWEGHILWVFNTNLSQLCFELFPLGSAENEESSSDVQAEGGKLSGMYYY